MFSKGGSDDQRLDVLFQEFRRACPDPEATPNFMPQLWAKIEARQRVWFSFPRMASAFLTAALALSVALGVFLSSPGNSGYYSQSYIEALTTQDNTADFLEPAHLELR